MTKISSALLIAAFASLAVLPGRSQILADAATNYQTGTIGSAMTPVPDSFGTGTWSYDSAIVDSDSNPTAIISQIPLTYQTNSEGGSVPFYGFGTTANAQVPAVSNNQIFPDSPAPAADYLEVHPGADTNAALVEWTAAFSSRPTGSP